MLPPLDGRWSEAGRSPLLLVKLVKWWAQPFLCSPPPASKVAQPSLFSFPPSSHPASDPGEQALFDLPWLHEWLSSVELSPSSCPIGSGALGPPFIWAGVPSNGFHRANWLPVTCWWKKPVGGCSSTLGRLLPLLPSRVCSSKRTWLSTSAACNVTSQL